MANKKMKHLSHNLERCTQMVSILAIHQCKLMSQIMCDNVFNSGGISWCIRIKNTWLHFSGVYYIFLCLLQLLFLKLIKLIQKLKLRKKKYIVFLLNVSFVAVTKQVRSVHLLFRSELLILIMALICLVSCMHHWKKMWMGFFVRLLVLDRICTYLKVFSFTQPGVEPGDVILVLQQKDHELFTRQGDDLFMTKKIHLAEALCGFHMVIKHLDKRNLVVKYPAGQVIEPG